MADDIAMDSDITLSGDKPVAADMNAETEFFFAPTGGAAYWSGTRWVMLDDMCDLVDGERL